MTSYQPIFAAGAPNFANERLQRVCYEVEFECQTNLHVGDGSVRKYERERSQIAISEHQKELSKSGADLIEAKPCYQAFSSTVHKGEEKLCIFGSTLRAAFRRHAEKSLAPKQWLSLFGRKDVEEEQQQGGCVIVHDAFPDVTDQQPTDMQHWSASRQSGLYTRNRLDNATHTAADGALFNIEYLGKGTKVVAHVVLLWPEPEDVENFDALISEFYFAESWGAFSSKDWGQVKIRKTSKTMEVIGTPATETQTSNLSIAPLPQEELADWLQIDLATRQPVHIGNPAAVKKQSRKGSRSLLDLDSVTMISDGQAIVPSTSFWGAFKSCCLRYTTSLVHAVNPLISIDEASQKADELCAFLGSTQRKALHCRGLIAEGVGTDNLFIQQFQARDNLTGANSDGALFGTASIPPETKLFGGSIHLPESLTHAELEILLGTFDLISIMGFRLGKDQAKGHGLCSLENADAIKKKLNNKISLATEKTPLSSLLSIKTDSDESDTASAKPVQLQTDKNSEHEQGGYPLLLEEHNNRESRLEKDHKVNPYSLMGLISHWTEDQGITIPSAIKDHSLRHDCYLQSLLSGKLTCELQVVSPTCVGNRHTKYGDEEQKPTEIESYKRSHKGISQAAIPASSLRGMLQHCASILSCSSLKHADEKGLNRIRAWQAEHSPGNLSLLPLDTKPIKGANPRQGLSPTELIFGVVGAERNNGEADKLASRVQLTDALFVGTTSDSTAKTPNMSDFLTLPYRGTPRVNPAAIAFEDRGLVRRLPTREHVDSSEMDVLKFLRTNPRPDRQHNYAKAQFILPPSRFRFELHFTNLRASELDLLLTAIDPLCKVKNHSGPPFQHKIGLAAGLGAGSVQLKVTEVEFLKLNPAQPEIGSTTQLESTKSVSELAVGNPLWVTEALQNYLNTTQSVPLKPREYALNRPKFRKIPAQKITKPLPRNNVGQFKTKSP